MASVILNGVTYTDDSNAVTGLANGGHRTRFVPCLSDFLAEAATQITAAAAQVALATAQTSDAAAQANLATTNGAAQVALAAAQVALAAAQAGIATTQATTAATSATAASSAASSAGFAGAWSSLTGALATPASVSHNGQFWALSVSLADVTTAEPGVDARWYAVGGISESDTLFINFFLG